MILDNAFAPDLRVQKETKGLKELGFNVTIFAWDRECKYKINEEKDGINIKRIRTKSTFRLGLKQLFYLVIFYLKALPALLRIKMDVIYCHDLLMLPLGILIKLLRRKKLIYDAHEIYWLMEIKKYNKLVLKSIKFIENMIIQFVDRFITVSEQRALYYKEFYKKQIYIVGNYYNPVDISTDRRKNLRIKLGIPSDKILITYIGGLHLERDFELLIKYASKNKHIFVLIAGLGYWENFIQDAAKKMDNVKYIGWVSNPIEYYSISDIIYYVLKEDYEYNHFNAPNNIYLSIALKVPIVATPIGDAGKIIKQYGIGAPIECRDIENISKAVEYIIKNRKKISANLEKIQEIYNWNISKNELKKAVSLL